MIILLSMLHHVALFKFAAIGRQFARCDDLQAAVKDSVGSLITDDKTRDASYDSCKRRAMMFARCTILTDFAGCSSPTQNWNGPWHQHLEYG